MFGGEKRLGAAVVRGASILVISACICHESHAREKEGGPVEAAPADAIVLDPVDITTRGVVERLQDAPVSVSVTDAADLTIGRKNTIEEVLAFTPNVTYWGQGSIAAPSISIRGVGGIGGAAGIDRQQGVAMFFDDVYIARPTGYPSHFFDLGGAEVARGPQAVLHGRSATAGTVAFRSVAPGDDLGGFVSATLGTDTLRRTEGALDVPVADRLRTRTAFALTRKNGTLKDPDGATVGDLKNGAVRFVADIDPTDNTTARFSVDYAHDNQEGWAFGPIDDILKKRFYQDERPLEKRDVGGASLRLDHSFDAVDVTSITAYRGYSYDVGMDGDYTVYPVALQGQWQRQRQFTQELRFSGTAGNSLGWMFGGFYLWESLRGEDWYDLASIPNGSQSATGLNKKTNSYSAFGSLRYDLTDRLELAGGLRYTYETNDGRSYITSPYGTNIWGPPAEAGASKSFSGLTPEVSLSYRVTDDILTYGRISKGWRAGGFGQFVINGEANIYDPESVWSYEIGAKTQWLDRRLTVNAAAFYNDWKDMQVVMYIPPGARMIANAESARSRGFELESALQVTGDLILLAGYGFLDAKYTDFKDPYMNMDYSGNRVAQSPKHSVSLGARYDREIFSDIDLTAGVDYSFKSDYYFMAENGASRGDVHLLDARIGLAWKTYAATVWAKNLLDETYLAGYFKGNDGDLGARADGRSFGVTLTAGF